MKRFIFSYCLLLTANLCFGATIYIPMEQPTIQAGVDASNNNDTLFVADGIYNEHVLVDNKSITFLSENGSDFTSLDSDTSRCMTITNCDSIYIEGFTFTGKSEENGGAICVDSSNLTIKNSQIINSSVIVVGYIACGGGIYSTNSQLILSGCTIRDNIAQIDYSIKSNNLRQDESELMEKPPNETENILPDLDRLEVRELGAMKYSELLANSLIIGGGTGGGIYSDNSDLTLFNCIVDGNIAQTIGTIKNNTNKTNGHSSAVGGGIYCIGQLVIDSQSVISGNGTISRPAYSSDLRSAYGGGIYCESDNAIIRNSSIFDNSCSSIGSAGGGIYLAGDFFLVENCLIRENELSGGWMLAQGGGVSIYGNSGDFAGNIIENNYFNSYSSRSWMLSEGGGLYISGNDNTVSGNTITDNKLTASISDGYPYSISMGGGCFISGSNTFIDNIIANNSAISSCILSKVFNKSFSSLSNTYIEPNEFSSSSYGGGCYISDAAAVTNNTIVGNLSTALVESSISYEANFTIESYGAGCYIKDVLDYSHNINAFNKDSTWYYSHNGIGLPEEFNEGGGVYDSSSNDSCNVYYGNIGTSEWFGVNSVSNINENPLFCDTANNLYTVMDFSPCLPVNNDCDRLIGVLGEGCLGIPSVQSIGATDETLSNLINHNPEFNWKYFCPSGNAQTEFEIAVSTDDDWEYGEMWNPAPAQTSDEFVTYEGVELIDGETYYLRLRINDGLAWSLWYETPFQMNSKPSIPELLSPIDSAVVITITPYLWIQNALDAENDELFYDFAVEVDCLLYVGSNIPQQIDTTGWMIDPPLSDNKTYNWSVRSYDGFEYSNWANLEYFRVDLVDYLPTEFDLIFPPDTGWSQVYDFPTPFSWQESYDHGQLDSVYYKLIVAIDSEFTFSATYDSIYQNSYLVPDLRHGTHYWWKVQAFDTKGNMTESNGMADFLTWVLGDANANGVSNIGDCVFLINYVFKNGPSPDPVKVGDVNGDCCTNLGDAVYIINYLFKGGLDLLEGCWPCSKG